MTSDDIHPDEFDWEHAEVHEGSDALALQALVTGMLAGAMVGQKAVLANITPAVDDKGDYQPWFYVEGKNSGIRLKVAVTIEP